jgi:hypothetical protein
MATTVATYILRIMADKYQFDPIAPPDTGELVGLAEQRISDQLPEGYYCNIEAA